MTGQEQIIDRAKKLKELADRGIDGEKDTATRMYASYKQKHNLTDNQVTGHRYTESFKVSSSNVSNEEFLKDLDRIINSEPFQNLLNILVKSMFKR